MVDLKGPEELNHIPKVSTNSYQQELEKNIKVDARSIDLSYDGIPILNDINIQVQEGEFLVLMGPSGCGKSSFLRLVAGLESPTDGDIFINGHSVLEKKPDYGVVFQDYSLFPWLSAQGNIVLALKQKLKKTKSKKELQYLASQYLELVNLGHAIKKYPGQMSGGMKQRAAIARALSFGSDLLLMDEPFGALDPITRVQLQDLMLQISREQKRTIVFVTHDADEAIYLADRIIMFSIGDKGAKTTSFDVPFGKNRNRQKLFESQEFSSFREDLLQEMNRELLNKLEQKSLVDLFGGL